MKKFELTSESITKFGRTLFRIKALISFGNVSEGELGGFVEKEENINPSGNAWVYGNARVYGDAEVSGNARVYGNARVSGDAEVSGNAWVYGDAEVYGNARVSGDAEVSGNARVYGDAEVYGNARVYGNAWVYGNAEVYGDAEVYGNARVYGDAEVSTRNHISWFSNVGSENGTLTAYITKSQEIEVTRGCFRGTIGQFEAAVQKTHGDSQYGQQYAVLIEFIKLRFLGLTVQIEATQEVVQEEIA